MDRSGESDFLNALLASSYSGDYEKLFERRSAARIKECETKTISTINAEASTMLGTMANIVTNTEYELVTIMNEMTDEKKIDKLESAIHALKLFLKNAENIKREYDAFIYSHRIKN
jgi:phage terminase large subunit-like protein